MEQKQIIFPMAALVGWTYLVSAVMLRRAFRAVAGGLNPAYFRYGGGFEAPGSMRAAYQHFNNLFETPVLFYAGVLTVFAARLADPALLALAWAYVAARVVHGVIHLRDRGVSRRRDSFLLSVAILFLLWVVIVWRLAV